jgi:hypothetical protein
VARRANVPAAGAEMKTPDISAERFTFRGTSLVFLPHEMDCNTMNEPTTTTLLIGLGIFVAAFFIADMTMKYAYRLPNKKPRWWAPVPSSACVIIGALAGSVVQAVLR